MDKGISFAVRPMTEMEKMYCYTQSQQLRGQTGCIGFLRGDLDTGGEEFFSSWNDFSERLKTQEFKDEFDKLIGSLRDKNNEIHFLSSRTALADYCHRHAEAQIDSGNSYGFRADTERYSYMMRLDPAKGVYNLYCYCYVCGDLDRHLKQAEEGIRFIDSNYKELFRIHDGGKIRVTYSGGSVQEFVCRYIDPTHVEIGGGYRTLFHICEFAEQIESTDAKCEPADGGNT